MTNDPLGLFDEEDQKDPLGLFAEGDSGMEMPSYMKDLPEKIHKKTEAYKKDAGQFGKDLMSLGLPIGVLEQIPAGAQAVGSILTGGLGGVAGALIPGDTATQGMERSQKAFNDATEWLLPKTQSGQALAGGVGAVVDKFKEDVALLGSGEYPSADPNAPEWAKKGRAAFAAGASAGPEVSMLVPMLGSKARAKTKAKDAAPNKDAAFEASSSSTVDQLSNKPLGEKSPMESMAQSLEKGTPEIRNLSKDGYQHEIPDNWEPLPNQQPHPAEVMGRMVDDLRNQGDAAREYGPLFDQLDAKDRALALDKIKDKFRTREEAEAYLNAQARQQRAQQVLDERQAQMEQNVRQQQSLDFNAAERARQEQGSTGYQAHAWEEQQRAQIAETEFGKKLQEQARHLDELQKQIDAAQATARTAAEQQKYAEVQKQLEAKRAELDFQVKRQATLEMNAVERARQENASGLENHYPSRVFGQMANDMQRDLPGAKKLTGEGPPIPHPEQALDAGLKTELFNQAVENHPLVRKAMERVQKQEELITKLQMQQGKGRGSVVRLAREVKNLENFEKAAERTRENVTESTREGTRTMPFNFKKQGGAINPEVFKEGFEKLKKLADGTTLRAYKDRNGFNIEAKKDGRVVGNITFDNVKDNLEAFSTGVSERRKGYATEMYKFASELGNDIRESPYQTADGKALWNGFEKKGLAENGRFKSQRGALLIDPKDGKKGEWLADQPHLKLKGIVPTKWTVEGAKEAARAAKDVSQNALQGALNYFTKGGLYQTMKTDNPLIKFANEKIMESDRGYRAAVQRLLHEKEALGPLTRALSDKELVQITEIMNEADLGRKPLSEEGLRAGGYNEKQIAYWKKHKEGMGEAFKQLNEARKAAGLEPMDPRISYASMRSKGDYKRLVMDGENNIVGVIGSDYPWKVNKVAKQLEEQGYKIGEERYYGGMTREKGKAEYELMQTLEALAEKDSRVKEFMITLDELTRNEAYAMLGMKKHTMAKKGVFGMEGRKTEAWADKKLAEQNAREFAQAQMDYIEGAMKFGHMSKAVGEIRPLLADEHINMPIAKQWVRDYVDNALGYNPTVGHYLEKFVQKGLDAKWLGDLRVGNSAVRRGIAGTRKAVNTLLLGLNPGFWAANFVQPFKAMPGMRASLVAKGLDPAFDFGTGYNYMGKAALTDAKIRFAPEKLSAVEKGARQYTKDNYVFGSDLVEHSNRARKDAVYYLEQGGNLLSGKIERGTREVMFYSFVHMLNENGLSVKNGLYEAAHNLTDMTMNNYSRSERPPIYNVAGPLGETAANLASFKHNELSRLASFARQIKDDKSAKPLLTELATQVAFAGVKGVIGFTAADWLYKQLMDYLGTPDSLSLRVIKMSENLGEALGAKEGGKHVLSHGGFSLAGVDMSNRLGLSNLVGDNLLDIAAPGFSKLVDVGKAGVEAVKHPSEMNAKRFVREASPAGFTGVEDLAWFSKDGGRHPINRKTDKLQPVERNNYDMFWKSLGMTGVNESVSKEKLFDVKTITKGYQDKAAAHVKTARDELFTDGKISQETFKKYLEVGGDPKNFQSAVMKSIREQNLNDLQRERLQSAASKSIARLRHLQRLNDAYKEEQ